MQTKRCSMCKNELPLESFSKNHTRKDGLCGACKECNKAYHKIHYKKNKQDYLDKSKRRRKKLSKDWALFKSTLKCKQCGYDKHPVALDFHHKDPSKKDEGLARLITTGSMKRIQEELEKCDVLCANCHRILHYIEEEQD